ncbi:hypothetical protein SDC9_164827 [bioreactor metagenome]|uniref:Uncharacterized protein n=1 Tax=bioreactor metagenome TaxID=1076179 RepID=A0A645G036_9ZZZZ
MKKLKSAGGRLTIDFFDNTVLSGDFITALAQSHLFKVKNKESTSSLLFFVPAEVDIIKYTAELIMIFIGK